MKNVLQATSSNNVKSFSSISYYSKSLLLLQLQKDKFQRNFKNFKEQNFPSDLKKIDWDTVFSDCKQDVDL